jgi:hypothetical protein
LLVLLVLRTILPGQDRTVIVGRRLMLAAVCETLQEQVPGEHRRQRRQYTSETSQPGGGSSGIAG